MIRPTRIFVLLQVIILLIFYWPMLSGHKVFYWQDHTLFFEPQCAFIGRALAGGHLPLWNPYSYCGMPQIAVSSPSIFYPLNWLFAFMSYSKALSVILIVSQTICGLGGYLLVTYLGWGILPAILCGAALTFNGYMFSLSSNYTLVATASWVPLSIWLTFKIADIEKSKLSVATVGLSACLFMLIAAGRPEVGFPSLAIITLLFLYIYLAQHKDHDQKQRRQRLVAHLTALTLGVLAAMPVILPALEWLPTSPRAHGLKVFETVAFSANWYDLLNMFASQLLGSLHTNANLREELFGPGSMGGYFESAFIGSIVIVLAGLGLARKGSRLYALSVVALILTVNFSLGANGLFTEALIHFVRPLVVLRFPCKCLFFTIFLSALFAARGLDYYLNGKPKLSAPILLTGALSLIGVFVWTAPNMVLPFSLNVSMTKSHLAIITGAQHLIGRGLTFWSLFALLATVALAFCQRRWRNQGAALVVVLALGGLLYNAFVHCRVVADADYYQKISPVAACLNGAAQKSDQQPQRARYMHLGNPYCLNPASAASRDLLADIARCEHARQVIFDFTGMDFDVYSSWGFEAAAPGDLYLLRSKLNSKALQRLASTARSLSVSSEVLARSIKALLQVTAAPYVVTDIFRYADLPPGIEQDSSEAKRVNVNSGPVPVLDSRYFDLIFSDPDINARVYKLKNSLPRAYLSFNWKSFAISDRLLEQIWDADNSNFDPTATTLLDAESARNLPASSPSAGPNFIALKVNEPYPEHITIDAYAPAPSLLVLADRYYPGWVARVDGSESPILKCNGLVRAVQLSAGRHVVSFDYQPKSLYLGYLLAAIAVAWAFALVFSARLSSVRPSP